MLTLGWEMLAVDPDEGTIEVAFTAAEHFVNPAGDVQGGFLAAMLDDTLGPALVATLGEGEWAPTIDLHVQFLRAARPGRLLGSGRVVRRGRDIAFLAGGAWPKQDVSRLPFRPIRPRSRATGFSSQAAAQHATLLRVQAGRRRIDDAPLG